MSRQVINSSDALEDSSRTKINDNFAEVFLNVTTIASSATPTPDASKRRNLFTVTALAAGAVFAAPSGTHEDGDTLMLRVKDNGTARSLGFNAIYRAIGIDLPSTTVLGKTLYILAVYNAADTKWDCLAIGQQE